MFGKLQDLQVQIDEMERSMREWEERVRQEHEQRIEAEEKYEVMVAKAKKHIEECK